MRGGGEAVVPHFWDACVGDGDDGDDGVDGGSGGGFLFEYGTAISTITNLRSRASPPPRPNLGMVGNIVIYWECRIVHGSIII